MFEASGAHTGGSQKVMGPPGTAYPADTRSTFFSNVASALVEV